MSYYLQAIICKQDDAKLLTANFDKASIVDIGQHISLIPMTHELYDQMNASPTSVALDGFDYLTQNIEDAILKAFASAKVAYVEAEYFGGRGGQMAITWENRMRTALLQPGKDRINQVLKDFGVITLPGVDEFSTLDLDRHRKTSHWIV